MLKNMNDAIILLKMENEELKKYYNQQKLNTVEIEKIKEDLTQVKGQEIAKLKEDLTKVNNEKGKEITKLKEDLNQLNDVIQAQKVNIDALNNVILNKNITIEENEKNIEELKQDLSSKKIELKKNKQSLNEKQIKIDNYSRLSITNSQQITNLTNKVNSLQKTVDDLQKQVKTLQNKIDLIGCRDFLRTIFMDFCFLFHFYSKGNYKETSKFIVDKIKKEDNKSQIKIFSQKVNLFAFIELLGKIIDEYDN